MNNYNCLDLDVIKNRISAFASIDEAKTFIIEEAVPYNPLVIKNNLKLTSEAIKIAKDNNIKFSGIENPAFFLEKAEKGITLNGNELNKLLSFHNHCFRLKRQFTQFEKELSLRDYTDSISVNLGVFETVENCIDNTGEVRDDASSELKRINKELNQCENDLINRAHTFIDKHQGSLQEPSIYFRNDRVTFLIKNSDKNKYSGYLYGSSSSGLATYVEPGAFIELNNKKISLLEERENEIDRILKHLTYLVASVSETYNHNFESLMMLNVIFAKAEYGISNSAVIGTISEDMYFDLKDLCHPLINPKKVVSNSYRLYEPYQGIVISGSNTGGKTVSLKAIGLSVLMSYLGIPVIASEVKVPLYNNVFVDIDDNQSIADSLSTFSAHITNINEILKNADNNSLILIDELISGTDPKQAQAISLAIMEKIEEIGSTFVITTHFDDIKNYAYKNENILLSSVGFNMETLTPTYKYLEDSVGSSNALEIASRFFDDNSIIDRAKYYLDLNKSQEDELLDKLAKQIEVTELEKDKLLNLEKQNKQLKEEYDSKIKAFELEKDKLKEKYISDLNAYVDDISVKALDKLDSIVEKKDIDVVKEIENLKVEDDIIEDEHVFAIGDSVRISDNEQIGKILELEGNNAVIDIRGIKVKTNISKLKYIPVTVEKKNKTTVSKPRYARVPQEINLVGLRVDEAIEQLEPYIDKALAANMSTVKVIHGIGTGALRSAVREKLKHHKMIKSIKDGDFYDGGSAVTIVEFK